jgi:GNAT superfamily N-acetyltransferase
LRDGAEVSAWSKLHSLWAARGWRGAASALRERLLFKRWCSLVLTHDAPLDPAACVWPASYRYAWYEGVATMPAAAREALHRQSAGMFLEDLQPADHLYVVWAGDDVATYGAVLRHTPQISVLGLPRSSCLVGLCETLPVHRGRGLFSLALMQTVQVLRDHGQTDIFIEVVESNVASRDGILKAGFRHWARVDAHIWFGLWVQRSGQWQRLQRGSL